MKNVLKCIFLLLVCFLFIGSECENEKQYPYVSTPAADKFINAGVLAYPLDYDSTLSITYVYDSNSDNYVQLHYITKEGEEKLAIYNPGVTILGNIDSVGGKKYLFPYIFNFEHLPE